jgi:hypothetical protein
MLLLLIIGFKKYSVGAAVSGVIYIIRFLETAKVIKKAEKERKRPSPLHTHIRMRTHRDNGDFIGLFSFLEMEFRDRGNKHRSLLLILSRVRGSVINNKRFWIG